MHISLGEFTSFSEIVCCAGFILKGDGDSHQDEFEHKQVAKANCESLHLPSIEMGGSNDKMKKQTLCIGKLCMRSVFVNH